MNIVTIPIGGKSHYLRPDTSYNKDHSDYFCPDPITTLAAVPFIYVRLDKAAKAVSSRFAPRYYSTIGYGVRLLAPELIVPGSPETWWLAHSLDQTTYLGPPFQLTQCESVLDVVSDKISGIPYLADNASLTQKINSSLEAVTQYTSLKTGDYLTLDLQSEQACILKKESHPVYTFGEINIRITW